ncbi:MAG: hypothetical protein WDN00_08310 [Limisphaerales bacterium]
MKKLFIVIPALLLAAAPSLMAAETSPVIPTWHAQTLLQAIGNVLLFAAVGIFAAIVGFQNL